MARPKGNRPTPAKRPEQQAGTSGTRRPLPQASDKPARDWKPILLWGAGGVVLVAFIVAVVVGLSSEVSGIPEGVQEIAVDPPQHVDGEIEYDGHPAGGPHNPVWLNCGVYTEPVPEENAVHSLEHGAVWITYPTGSEPELVDRLEGYAGRPKMIVSPVDGQTSPVLLTAWGVQMETDDPDDRRIEQFIAAFNGGGNAPEPGGACTGGVGQPA